MHPVDLLLLDDAPSSPESHLTEKQRLNAFDRIWDAMTEEQKLKLREETPNAA